MFGARLIGSGLHADALAASCCCVQSIMSRTATKAFFRQRPLKEVGHTLHTPALIRAYTQQQQQHQRLQICHHHHLYRRTMPRPLWALPNQRQLSSRRNNNRRKVDDNALLLNEHLIAELFKKKKQGRVSADTYQVRLVVDQGRGKKSHGGDGTDDHGAASTPKTQITTVNEAIAISHELALDLVEVALHQDPPVIKAVDFDRWLYEQKKRERQAATKKKREGGGAISDRPLKEFKFRAGIADHDLERKTNDMIDYLGKGHAIRVTLTARRHMLNADEGAITTTFERVKELVGDQAVEVRGMKANERKSYGSLLLHPKK
mmetsp:Transcript_19474/g.41664  ORF Transcript_19474/g.41664 Transcript_19474/m.41664 type:complete len:319 (+) Transcript_19474:49-1005(+)